MRMEAGGVVACVANSAAMIPWGMGRSWRGRWAGTGILRYSLEVML